MVAYLGSDKADTFNTSTKTDDVLQKNTNGQKRTAVVILRLKRADNPLSGCSPSFLHAKIYNIDEAYCGVCTPPPEWKRGSYCGRSKIKFYSVYFF